jgi:hypothetical protein
MNQTNGIEGGGMLIDFSPDFKQVFGQVEVSGSPQSWGNTGLELFFGMSTTYSATFQGSLAARSNW